MVALEQLKEGQLSEQLKRLMIKKEELTIHELIGKGSFGEARRAPRSHRSPLPPGWATPRSCLDCSKRRRTQTRLTA